MYDKGIRGPHLFRIKCNTIKIKCIVVSIILKVLYSALFLLFYIFISLNPGCVGCSYLFLKFFYSFTFFVFIIISYSFIMFSYLLLIYLLL